MQQPVTAPPVPERVRTLAAAAVPTHVSLAGTAEPAWSARGGVDRAGRPVLLVLPGDPLHGMRDEPVVTVDLTASRSLGGVELSRGLLKVQGWAQAVPERELRETAIAIADRCPDEALFEVLERRDGPRLLRVDVGQVIYLTGPESGVLDAEEYLDAAPDPLTAEAERMVRHVNDAHRDRLSAALGALLSEPAGDVWLWELDRFGATVRSGIEDPTLIRLPWPAPAGDTAALERALHCLLCHR
ncbi:hypothetical protein Ppa06_42180 [Planomonospora parontospora subsp. parontospora]|uniref:DUF2470 domain-containing protein n=2 Tax=Planomonospora parontospora TaxID=58119 RepID=A0AA37F6A2_9ACTN|nr:DUF2470 domain-containing protein [Planomonospora parontospora]GGK83110.1 hypothetical protein GCM10010126_48040 [Planomonospora parontospora]GII10420.1 hypothetical protein Ppa06_42180 [Planomonospora parontospora subsp. parontospora]